MFRICIIGLLMAVIAMAGCNKTDAKKAPPAGAKGTPASTDDTQAINDEPVNVADILGADPDAAMGAAAMLEDEQQLFEQGLPELPEEDQAFIRAELIRVAPDHGFIYEEEANVLLSDDLPEEGLDFEVVVDRMVLEVRRDGGNASRDAISKWCTGLYAELKPKAYVPSAAPVDKKQNRQSSGKGRSEKATNASTGNKSTVEDTLIFAPSAEGEWRSLREEHPRITTYHNEEYFEFYRILPNGKTEIKHYRDGRMSTFRDFDYDYNPRNGKLSLFNDKNELATFFILKIQPGDEDTLYIETPGKDSKTVFEKIGDGKLAVMDENDPAYKAGLTISDDS